MNECAEIKQLKKEEENKRVLLVLKNYWVHKQ